MGPLDHVSSERPKTTSLVKVGRGSLQLAQLVDLKVWVQSPSTESTPGSSSDLHAEEVLMGELSCIRPCPHGELPMQGRPAGVSTLSQEQPHSAGGNRGANTGPHSP